jgi:hypothetical protein
VQQLSVLKQKLKYIMQVHPLHSEVLAICQSLEKNFRNKYKSPVAISINKASVNMYVAGNNALWQNT